MTWKAVETLRTRIAGLRTAVLLACLLALCACGPTRVRFERESQLDAEIRKDRERLKEGRPLKYHTDKNHLQQRASQAALRDDIRRMNSPDEPDTATITIRR